MQEQSRPFTAIYDEHLEHCTRRAALFTGMADSQRNKTSEIRMSNTSGWRAWPPSGEKLPESINTEMLIYNIR